MATRAPDRAVSQQAMAQGARRIQLRLRADLIGDVTRAWPALNFADLGSSWPAWLQVMSALLRRYHAQSASSAALYYQAARQVETGDAGGPGLVQLSPDLDPGRVARSLGWAAPGVYQAAFDAEVARLGDLLDVETARLTAEHKALVQTLGTSSRLALNGGRQTLADTADADRKCYGFARVTDGDPCYFCALVASRGAVYKTAESAGESRMWHNACGCTVAPAFSATFEIDGVAGRAQDIYYSSTKGVPAAQKMAAFRKAWTNRDI